MPMKTIAHESSQTMQRLKVGMTGLALVLLLIGLASAIFSSASKETAVDVAGAPKPDVVANISITNDSMPIASATPSEPLAELGVTPSTSDDSNSATAAKQSVIALPVQPATQQ